MVFVVVLGCWLVIPLLLYGGFAQDAVPYVVAGELVRADPDAVYASQGGDLFTLEPAFAQRYCELVPADRTCGDFNVAFVATPLVLPAALALAAVDPDVAVLLVRLLGAAALVGGMWSLWQRLAHRDRKAGPALAGTALLLTPWIMVPTALGQTSQVLFLSAALGVSMTRRPGRAATVAAVWLAAIVLKVYPAALVAVLVWCRRWPVVAWAAAFTAALTVVTLLVAPGSLLGEFLRSSSELSVVADSNPYNSSVGALAHGIWPPLASSGVGNAVLWAFRLVLAGAAGAVVVRRADDDTLWAFGYLVVLLFVPFVWWHYLLVAIAALGVAIAARPAPGRLMGLLPAAAALGLPMSVVIGFGAAWPVAQGAYLVAGVIAVAWVVASGDRSEAVPELDPAPRRAP